jgi:hypothetical protein
MKYVVNVSNSASTGITCKERRGAMYRPFLQMILEDLHKTRNPQEKADILYELASYLYERKQWHEGEGPAIKAVLDAYKPPRRTLPASGHSEK